MLSEDDYQISALRFRSFVVGFWILFGALLIGISLFFDWVRGAEIRILSSVIWYSNFFLWAIVSFIVVYFARRFPIDRKALVASTLRQLLLGLGVVVIHSCIDILYSFIANELLFDHTLTAKKAAGIFVYKFNVNLIVYLAVLGAVTAYDNYTKLRRSELASSQLEAKLAQAQLSALKMQLHPHFLFNTHNSIMSLMMKKDNDGAIRMLTRLSDLLRLTLDKSNEQVVPLKDELDSLDLYLSIQKERFQERLETKIDVDPDILDAEVPYLLLQPIVENALQHGIGPKTEGGFIHVAAAPTDAMLQIVVKDSGVGIPGIESAHKGNGIGLTNTRVRLKGLYGDDHNLVVKSIEGVGTEVVINLPHKKYVKSR